jgi:glycosyltransferase involved in cell wall biosynthesis
MFKDIPEVSFMGIRDNIPSYMKGVDYVVQLSDSEGFCYSVYEALSVGTPVIVNSWAGVENVIQNGYNGYILNDILDLDLIYSKKPKIPPTTFVENADNWLSLFNKK